MNSYLYLASPRIGGQVEDDARAIGQRARDMQRIQPFTVAAALAMLKGGQEAIAKAIDIAKMTPGGELTGAQRRQNVQGHLQWHADNLAQYMATPNAIYPNAADLQTWVLEGFIQLNLSTEGRAYLGNSQLWERRYNEAMNHAKEVWTTTQRAADAITAPVRAAAEGAEKLLHLPGNLFQIPWYVWVMVTVPVAYIGFRILTRPTAGHVLATRFFGRER